MAKHKKKVETVYLSVADLATRWDISLAHCYRAVERGIVPHIRIGASIRIALRDVEAFEHENTIAARGAA